MQARSNRKHGLLITFEGIEGSGKTTQIQKLATALKKMKHPVSVTFEPGATPFGKIMRDLLMGSKRRPLLPESEVFLFLADRVEHVQNVILPALRKKQIVLCDRFVDSTLAYQAYGRNLPEKFLDGMNKFATRGLSPDLTLFLDISVEEGLRRIKKRKGGNPFDKEGARFYHKVRRGYFLTTRKNRRIVVLDASQSVEALHQQILAKVKSLL